MESTNNAPRSPVPDHRSGTTGVHRSGTTGVKRSGSTAVQRVVATVAIAALGLLLAAAPAQGQDGGGSLEDLRAERDRVQSQQAAQAAQVDALRSSAAEAQSALAALDAQVNAQRDRVEEAERAVTRAEDEQAQAEAAQAKAQRELDVIRADLRDVAVDAYISAGGSANSRVVQTASASSANEAVQMRALLEVRAGDQQDLIEDYRTVQDDLEFQRLQAISAAERAREQRAVVADRLAELDAAQDQQQAYTDQVEARVDAALAEAQSLAAVDAQLAASITARETELARAVAAQRESAAARDAVRSGQGLSSLQSDSGGGGTVTPPPVTGSGEIVEVGGIRIHQSIASNLSALLAAAANSGVPLSGSGYRDSARQIELRRQHCGSSSYAIYQASPSSCSPPTARPGSSMHERGLAVDFRNCNTRSTSCYQWLAQNASRFGFFNLPSEPWHWSTTGR